MRGSRSPVTILAVSLVILVTAASLAIAAIATYLTVRNGPRDGTPADFRNSLYQSLAEALLIGLLVSAVLCALLWRAFIDQVRALDAARQKTESMLATVLDAVPYCIWWKDRRGAFLGCNREFVAASGLRSADDVVGKTDFDLPWPRKDAEAYRADDQQILATNRPQRHIVEPIMHAGGSRRWADTTKVPLADPDGAPYGVLGVAEDITERKEAEEALKQERAFVDAMLHGLPGVVCLYDDQLRLVRWNPRVAEVSGYPDAELHGRHVLDWFPPDEKDRIAAVVAEAMRGGHVDLEADVMTKDGRMIPFYNTGVRMTIEGRTYLLTIGIDITARRRAEEALQRERALTDAMFDNIPGIIHLYDDHGRLVRWNAQATQRSGFSAAELLFKHVADGRTGEDRARMLDTFGRASREGRAAVETHLITRDGLPTMPLYVVGVRVTLDGKPHVLAIGFDITERKRVEEALLREKAFTDALFDNVPALLALYDDAGHLVRWNSKTNVITGYSDAELGAMVAGDRQPAEERPRIVAGVQLAMGDGIQNSQEATLLTKWGERLPFYFTGTRIILNGKPHLLAIGVDIRERKRAEEQLRRALEQAESANRAKDHFLAAVSHELRTPLAPILFLANALEADSRLPDDTRHDLADIREHAEIEKRLIADLLDFSAIHAGKLKIRPVPTDVHDVLRAAIRTCQDGIDRKRLRLAVRLDARRHHANGDPDRLRQVFWNLLQNACKFTPDECDLAVRTRDDDAGLTLHIEVADQGMGMTPETLERIFCPFEQGPRDQHTQHAGGLGLGLAISKSIVEAHGGTLSASSPGPNQGSTFTVTLPLHVPLHGGAERSAAPDSSSSSPATGNSQLTTSPLRILLIEDHPLTLKLLGRLLSADGHDVTTATTLAAARRAADERPFDLVLSDLTLPDGSALDLMPTLRDRHHLPGIALSGYGSPDDIDRSRRAGFLAHLIKPVTPDALRAALTEFVASQLTPAPMP